MYVTTQNYIVMGKDYYMGCWLKWSNLSLKYWWINLSFLKIIKKEIISTSIYTYIPLLNLILVVTFFFFRKLKICQQWVESHVIDSMKKKSNDNYDVCPTSSNYNDANRCVVEFDRGLKVVIQTSKTTRNPGRLVYTCTLPKGYCFHFLN